jgi:hypothetical protein
LRHRHEVKIRVRCAGVETVLTSGIMVGKSDAALASGRSSSDGAHYIFIRKINT